MAQIAQTFGLELFQRAIKLKARLLVALLLSFNCFVVPMSAQLEVRLLVQGPTANNSAQFKVGDALLWRLRGEEEFWRGRIVALYPESNAIRINDMLLSIEEIEGLSYRNQGRFVGLRSALRMASLVNLAVIGLVTAASPQVRREQKNFAIGAAAASAALVGIGSVNLRSQRQVGPTRRYQLVITGG